MKRRLAAILLGVCSLSSAQPTSVVNSPHNLSAGGPGPVRATMEGEVCIFCHTPHNASPIRPLWNRLTPIDAYTVYTSRALDAKPGQPTGTSKMCLSCHDGTIALGSVVSRGTPIQMAGGITTLPPGAANIGTDLSDDHPVSFRYDAALAGHDRKVKSPTLLPPQVRLDSNAELQCTACHDSHNNSQGKFLVLNNSSSQLCLSCHQMGTTTIDGHAQCSACHQPHTAPSGPYLLKRATIAETCTRCHDGSVAGATNVASDLRKPYIHETHSPVDPPGPPRDHASCTDCHEPHTMLRGSAGAPGLHPNFGRIAGVSGSGSPVLTASYEYEVCFKCHAEGKGRQAAVPRRIAQTNTRLEFSPSAVSYHPVEAPGRNAMVPSLRPGWTTASVMDCSACHGVDSTLVTGGGAAAVHGSNFSPILTARYETADYTSESASAYALCYRCHDRASILSDASFPGHKRHIVDDRAPCTACHTAHGIASSQGTPMSNSNLINFASTMVFPDRATGRLEFRDTGMFSGQCFLSCHGVDHSPMTYPAGARLTAPPAGAPSRIRRR